MEALERMYIHGHITESHGSEDAVKNLRCDSDTVQAWISEKCSLISGERTDRVDLYRNYEKYCEEYDRTALTRQGFYRAMKIKGFKEIKSHGIRFIGGISTKKSAPKSAPGTAPGWYEVNEQVKIPFS